MARSDAELHEATQGAADGPGVLVCLDRSALGERALPLAVALARTWRARLRLLLVLEPPRHAAAHLPADALDWELARTEGERYLLGVRERLQALELPAEQRIVAGHPAQEIVRQAREDGIDLTVLASHGGSCPAGWKLGSTAHMVLARPHGSILIVPAHAPPAPDKPLLRSILLPLDGSTRAESVLPKIEGLAREHACELVLVHAMAGLVRSCSAFLDEEGRDLARELDLRLERNARSYLDGVASRLAALGLPVRTLLRRGRDVSDVLASVIESEHCDLLVLSAHGATGSRNYPYGNTAQNLLARPCLPTWIVQDVPVESQRWHGGVQELRRAPSRDTHLYNEERP